MSPKRPSPAQQRISPAKWVRQEFEHPSPEVETAKRSLLYKLDEVSRGGNYHNWCTVYQTRTQSLRLVRTQKKIAILEWFDHILKFG